jgi:3-oxoacyl-[acyl-carrier-protein] synthase II
MNIAITGVGVVSPNGIGKEAFLRNSEASVSGIKPVTLFDTNDFRCHWAGEISDFQPDAYLGSKGLRNLDRTTLLAMVAAKLAIEDAQLQITPENCNGIGVVLGSTMGSIKSISDFDLVGLREGPRGVNPAHFPNTVINSPASHVAIRFGLRGLNSTISTGFTASHDAIGYGMDMLRLGRVKTLLVGGVEELCFQTFLGFYKVGLLERRWKQQEPPTRLDQLSGGTLLSEGAAFFVLESSDDAQSRGAQVLAELLAHSNTFHSAGFRRIDPKGTALSLVIEDALKQADVSAQAIEELNLSENGIPQWITSERAGIEAVLGQNSRNLPRTSPKNLIGESFSAGGAMQLAHCLSRRSAPAAITVGAERVGMFAEAVKQTTLITGFGPTGVASALILR